MIHCESYPIGYRLDSIHLGTSSCWKVLPKVRATNLALGFDLRIGPPALLNEYILI